MRKCYWNYILLHIICDRVKYILTSSLTSNYNGCNNWFFWENDNYVVGRVNILRPFQYKYAGTCWELYQKVSGTFWIRTYNEMLRVSVVFCAFAVLVRFINFRTFQFWKYLFVGGVWCLHWRPGWSWRRSIGWS